MSESRHLQTLGQLQRTIAADLKALRFRVRGRTFNRLTDDGLTQVIDFQSGPFDPPGTVTIPGLRENLYGRFTVNLGVYVPEVGLYTLPARTFVTESYCCIRARLGHLGPEQADLWWEIRSDAGTAHDVSRRLQVYGVPFLERFDSRDRILSEWANTVSNFGGGRPPRIVKAIILAARGQTNDARELLQQQIDETELPAHAKYVRDLARKLGIGALAD